MKPIKGINGLILATIWLGSAGWGQAAPTFAVNNTIDVGVISGALDNGICETEIGNGVCTLRAAIIKANHWPGGGVTINVPALPPGGKFLLSIPPSGIDDETTGNLNITRDMNILGEDAARTVIEGNSVASPDGGVINIFGVITVNISGVTIQNGKASNGGGGISNNLGTVTIINSTVNGNTSTSRGGGISNNGTMTVLNSTVSANTSLSDGGGININVGTITVLNSTVSANLASISGGAISNFGTVTILNSTISGNSARSNGGGIYNAAIASTSIFNSTITLNQADADFSGSGTGGGVFNANSFIFKNSIIARNRESGFLISFFIPVPGDCAGTLTSQGFNIVSTPNCTINGPFSQADPILGPLQNNGGPTQTHALLSGNPAIDAGEIPNCTDNLGAPITTDQRGLHRPANGGVSLRCDIGSFELYRFGIFLPVIMD